MFAKTELTLAESEKKSLAFREEIRVWSQEFAGHVQEIQFDAKPAVVVAKYDKKEVSVWKLVDGVSRPDFRNWSDSIDIQLEAIHGFVYPDLVFEKINRMPTEVTPMLLLKAIEEINIDHKKRLRAEKIITRSWVDGPRPDQSDRLGVHAEIPMDVYISRVEAQHRTALQNHRNREQERV